ncbi:hypothetical protein TNCV_4731381 [Trichonephila clavipes]|nr:hypothetical protein TNCV_4731381 [Trichonephila clavipes]
MKTTAREKPLVWLSSEIKGNITFWIELRPERKNGRTTTMQAVKEADQHPGNQQVGEEDRTEECQLWDHPRHLAMVENYEVRGQTPRVAE